MGQILGQIESGRRSIKQILPTYLTENHPSNEDGPIELPAASIAADNKQRSTSRNCNRNSPSVALLINETFLGKLQEVFNRDLGFLEGSLYHAEKETSQLERLLQRAQERFETADSEDIIDGCLKILENGPNW